MQWIGENVVDYQVIAVCDLRDTRPRAAPIVRFVDPACCGSQIQVLRVLRIRGEGTGVATKGPSGYHVAAREGATRQNKGSNPTNPNRDNRDIILFLNWHSFL